MITLSRPMVRSLRRVFRRATLGLGRRGPVPPLVFEAANDRLHVRHRQPHLVVEHAAPLAGAASGPIALPLDALADLDRGHGSPLTLEATGDDRTIVRWTECGDAQAREYVVAPGDGAGMILNPPLAWADPGPGLLDALDRAAITAGEAGGRYDLGCLLLKRGPHGHEVVATDGRQALIQGGFRLPWDGDVLVRSSPLFACRALPRDEPWVVGRAGGHVLLRSGPWTVALAIQADARFPRVDLAFPDPAAVATRLRLDPRDARGLPGALGRLPGGDRDHAPVTLDLNGHVAVRARGDGDGPAAELVLTRSSYTGTPVRLATCRAFLGRAAELGFCAVEVVDAKSPLVCRSGGWAYAWQPLDPDAILAPGDDDIRAEIACDGPAGAAPPPVAASTDPAAPPEPPGPSRPGPRRPTASEPAGPTEAADPVAEAEALLRSLADARDRARRLVAALRRQRRRDRQLRATLDSLRQIRLPDAAR